MQYFQDLCELWGHYFLEVAEILTQFEIDASVFFAELEYAMRYSEMYFMSGTVVLWGIILDVIERALIILVRGVDYPGRPA